MLITQMRSQFRNEIAFSKTICMSRSVGRQRDGGVGRVAAGAGATRGTPSGRAQPRRHHAIQRAQGTHQETSQDFTTVSHFLTGSQTIITSLPGPVENQREALMPGAYIKKRFVLLTDGCFLT